VRDRRTFLVLVAALLAAPFSSLAFDPRGHEVIEALAYRTLVEGADGQPARPDVLRDLINDGALVAPICFGSGAGETEACRHAVAANPLLAWPQPRTARPDNNYSRQFSQPGQCIHFMGMLSDQGTVPLPGRHVPRGLATTAVVRCTNLIDDMMRQIVVVGGVGTRESGYGLYELMHAVTDSFSNAHAERIPGTHRIDYLRVWGPLSGLLVSSLSDYYAESPLQHDASDVRDSAYVRLFAVNRGRPCRDLVDLPYTVPVACLSDEGNLARQAIVELLVVVRDLRQEKLAAPEGVHTVPRESEAWKRYTAKWFAPVHACEGAECQAKQPAELVEASGMLLGAGATINPSRSFLDLTARFRMIQWTQQSTPRPGTGGSTERRPASASWAQGSSSACPSITGPASASPRWGRDTPSADPRVAGRSTRRGSSSSFTSWRTSPSRSPAPSRSTGARSGSTGPSGWSLATRPRARASPAGT
jgi:hypothetical protein